MKRKICISLLVLALFVGSILPASACSIWTPSSGTVQQLLCRLGLDWFCTDIEPEAPETPILPEEPSEPNVPDEEPTIPEQPLDPETPETPILPEEPSEPDVPDEEPSTPEQPLNPEVPDEQSGSVHDYEREVVRLVNIEREKYGLSALTLREDLCIHARVKSQDMHDVGYFSHTSPTYGSPFEMMQSFGITYRTAGENIAMGYNTPQAVVEAWMNSEGHRANILSESYTHLGVGYVADGGYWTQWFVG